MNKKLGLLAFLPLLLAACGSGNDLNYRVDEDLMNDPPDVEGDYALESTNCPNYAPKYFVVEQNEANIIVETYEILPFGGNMGEPQPLPGNTPGLLATSGFVRQGTQAEHLKRSELLVETKMSGKIDNEGDFEIRDEFGNSCNGRVEDGEVEADCELNETQCQVHYQRLQGAA